MLILYYSNLRFYWPFSYFLFSLYCYQMLNFFFIVSVITEVKNDSRLLTLYALIFIFSPLSFLLQLFLFHAPEDVFADN